MSNEVRVPELGESVVSAVIASWLKREGDAVNQGDALVELETDKVNVEVSAEQSGVLQKIIKQVGDEVAIGDVLAVLGDAAGTQETQGQQEQSAQQASPRPVAAAPVTNGGSAPVSPLAQKIAADNNIDLAQVKGSSAH
ncbi:MAG TPA: biotin/lipoyl-containing protein, partial [Ktedonobacteraceae bacterium]|nr:biotin/lipoyl-containing protein [Ktedonobacteraceae bacterium]